MIRRRFALCRPLDLATTLAPLAHGRGERTIRLAAGEAWLACRTYEGAASLQIRQRSPTTVEAVAWGDGGEVALDGVPALIGEEDEPERLAAHHQVVHDLQRRNPGLRLPATRRVLAAAVPSILEQKVTGTEAFRAYAALLRRYGGPAPGPAGLLLPPDAPTLASLPYYAFHPLGVERRRAEVIRGVARRAAWLESARDAGDARRRLMALPGVGPWTAAEVLRSAFGDPDAVSVGDYHVPNIVAWALAGEPRADDARMLELLAPYQGQRGRVQRLLEVGGIVAPRYGHRMAPRSIAAI